MMESTRKNEEWSRGKGSRAAGLGRCGGVDRKNASFRVSISKDRRLAQSRAESRPRFGKARIDKPLVETLFT